MNQTVIEFIEKGRAALVHDGAPPELQEGQALVETLYSGVTNGTERHALLTEHGFGGGFPGRHGYQHIGRVIDVRGEVLGLQAGDLVFCGDYIGHRGWQIVSDGSLVLPLKQDWPLPASALLGVAGVAIRAVRRMRVGIGANVWVVGQGPIGHFLGQCSRAAGAEVTVSDLLSNRLDAARRAGIETVLDASDPGVDETLAQLGPFDFIFDACSAPNLLDTVFARRLLAHGGCIGMMAVRREVTYPWGMLHAAEARIETSCHYDRGDLRALASLVRRGIVDMKPIISDILPISEAPGLYERLGAGDPNLIGIVFDWT